MCCLTTQSSHTWNYYNSGYHNYKGQETISLGIQGVFSGYGRKFTPWF